MGNLQQKQTERWVKCEACRKLFTQTIYKKKASLPICPYCKKHNNEKTIVRNR